MTTATPRREFLKQSATAAAVAMVGGATLAPEAEAAPGRPVVTAHRDVPIVDCHQHLWDLNQFKLPWLGGAPAILSRTYLPAHYRHETAGLNVVKSVYMEVDVAPEEQVKEAEHLLRIIEDESNTTVGAVISGRPGSPDFKAYADRFKDEPRIKGFRRVLHPSDLPKGHCLEPQFVKSVQHMGEIGKSFDIVIRNTEISDGAKLADACPGTRFILDHCGNGSVQAMDRSQWRRDISDIAQRENVICKISGIIANADPVNWKYSDLEPLIKHCISEFGWGRVIFASDWPVCTLTAKLREWVACLKWIVRDESAENVRKLFHDNAVAFYQL